MVKKATNDIALVVQELEKARAALAVLYDQSAKEVAAEIAKLNQRCKATEARLRRLESTLQGSASDPGIVTQLWNIKQKLDILSEQPDLANSKISLPKISIPPSIRPSSAGIVVHPVWLYVVVPVLSLFVATLGGIVIWFLTK